MCCGQIEHGGGSSKRREVELGCKQIIPALGRTECLMCQFPKTRTLRVKHAAPEENQLSSNLSQRPHGVSRKIYSISIPQAMALRQVAQRKVTRWHAISFPGKQNEADLPDSCESHGRVAHVATVSQAQATKTRYPYAKCALASACAKGLLR